MRSMFYKIGLIFSCLQLIASHSEAILLENPPISQQAKLMIKDLEVIKHHYEVAYAPLEWKKEYSGWDIDDAFEKAKQKILSSSSLTTKQFQGIVRTFINSMKDYHVDVLFYSTEKASLPFGVKGVNDRYYIDWIDPLRLPPSHYDVSVGDELVEFDGRIVKEVLEELKEVGSRSSNEKTDQALAENYLTLRLGSRGDMVPKGTLIVKLKSAQTQIENSYQLRWAYTPEHVKSPFDFLGSYKIFNPFKNKSGAGSATPRSYEDLPKVRMFNPIHEINSKKMLDRDGSLGASKSFIPFLGDVIWNLEEANALEVEEESTFKFNMIKWHAYIYQHPNGSKIGYIRIPHYMANQSDGEEFGKTINFFQEQTDALVIDQVNNFGGFVNFQYLLASMLVNHEPLVTPHHRIKITQKEVIEAYRLLKAIGFMEEEAEDLSAFLEGDEDGLALNFQWLMFMKAYLELILDEWEKGHSLTKPTPILGVDRINKHRKYQYTKPILFLINELDFSGGDFMPAILQDNKRAVLFGTRTAGAGGYVDSFEFPNSHGIALCSYTGSIAERPDSKKIENLGVSPDIEYFLTQEDLQNNYHGYVEAVNKAVSDLVKIDSAILN